MCGDWRLGRFQTWILLANSVFPPRESCRSQALAPISCIYLSSGRGVRAHTHTHPPLAQLQGPVLAPLASWWETSDRFAITSEIYMLFWTLIHTFPCHWFESEAYGSSCQARKTKSCLHLLCLGWVGCLELTQCFHKSVYWDLIMIHTWICSVTSCWNFKGRLFTVILRIWKRQH